jgi:hypothetical protein
VQGKVSVIVGVSHNKVSAAHQTIQE